MRMDMINSAIEGVRSALDNSSSANESRSFDQISSALTKVLEDLISARRDAINSEQERTALGEEVELLKQEIVRLKDVKARIERYSPKPLESGASVYARKPEIEGFDDPHYICQYCASQFEFSPLQIVKVGRLTTYVCHGCKAQVQ